MLREELELDISQALARVDQLENALRAAVTGPLPIGVTVNDQALTSLRQQLAASDLDIDVDVEGEEAFRQLSNRLEEAEEQASQLVNEIEDVERPAREAARRFDDVADNLNRAEQQASELSGEMLQGAGSADRLEASIRELQTRLGLSESEARQLRDSMAAIERIDNMDEEVRKLTRELGLSEKEADDLRRSLARVDDEASRGGVDKFGQSLKRLATFAAAALVIRQVTRAIGAAITEFATFDEKLTESLAITSNVTDTLKNQFIDVSREVAQETRFGAEEAAEAFFFLASAGLDAAQQIEALPQVAQFAQAGMFDLALATDLLTDAQSALGLTVPDAVQNLENMARISDVLVKANVLANASVQQFSEALTNRAASAARLVGVEVEEVTAVLAAFADQGRKGAAAGEAVNIVLRDMQRAALKAPEEFERLGIAVFDAAGELRPIADIIGEMEVAIDGLSDAQVRATFTTLGFQDRSISNLLTLIGTSDKIREYEVELRKAAGTTEEIADKQMLSLAAALDVAGQQFDIFKTQAGEAIAPAAREFSEAVPEIIAGLESMLPLLETAGRAVADFFDQFSRETVIQEGEGQSFETWITQVVGGLGNAKDAVAVFGDVAGLAFSFINADAEGFAQQLDDINDKADRTEVRNVIIGINRELDRGRDRIEAFSDGLATFLQAGSVSDADLPAYFDQIVTSVGATDEEIRVLTQRFLDHRTANQLTAEAVEFFARKNLEVTDSLVTTGAQFGVTGSYAEAFGLSAEEAAQNAADLEDELETLGEVSFDAVDGFESFNNELAKTEGGTGDFIDAIEEQRGALETFLDPLEAAEIRLQAFKETVGEAAGVLRGEMGDATQDLINIFEGVPDQIEQSTDEILQNIIEQTTLQAEFEANLIRIGAAGGEALATALRDQGPQAAAAAEAYANDIAAALEAESQLTEAAGTQADRIGNAMTVALAELDLEPEVALFLAQLAEGFESESLQGSVVNTIEQQFLGVGEATADALEDQRKLAQADRYGADVVEEVVGGLRAQQGALTQGINTIFGELPGVIDPTSLNPGAEGLAEDFEETLLAELEAIDPETETRDIIEIIVDVLNGVNLSDDARNAMDELGDGIVIGIDAQGNKVYAAGTRLAGVVEQALKEGLEIRSPSRVMVRIGEQVAGDFANAMEEEFNSTFTVEPDFLTDLSDAALDLDPVTLPVEPDVAGEPFNFDPAELEVQPSVAAFDLDEEILPLSAELNVDDLEIDPLTVQVNTELAPGAEQNLQLNDVTVTGADFGAVDPNLVLASTRAQRDVGAALAQPDSVVAEGGQVVINLEGLETKDLDTALAKSTQAAVAVSSQLRSRLR